MKKVFLLMPFVIFLSACSGGWTNSPPRDSLGAVNYQSAQQLLDDLAFVGACDISEDTPDSSSQYGQFWKRDLYRACIKGDKAETDNLGESTSCAYHLNIFVGETMLSIPESQNDFYVEGSFGLSFFYGENWTVDVYKYSGNEYTSFHRCAQVLKLIHETLGGEVVNIMDFQLPSTNQTKVALTKKMFKEDYFLDGNSGQLVAWRYLTEAEDRKHPCKSKSCIHYKLIVSDYCSEVTIFYNALNSDSNVISAKQKTKQWPKTFKSFFVELPLPEEAKFGELDRIECVNYYED